MVERAWRQQLQLSTRLFLCDSVPYMIARVCSARLGVQALDDSQVDARGETSSCQLKTSDVILESQQEHLLGLEKLNSELNSEKQALVSKVGRLLCVRCLWC
jgi:hypothetical protein